MLYIHKYPEKYANEKPNKIAFAHFNNKCNISKKISYNHLNNYINDFTYVLNNWGFKKSNKVMLLYFPGINFQISLMACLKSGIIVIPYKPPINNHDIELFDEIVKDCKPDGIIINSNYRNYLWSQLIKRNINISYIKVFKWYTHPVYYKNRSINHVYIDPSDPAIISYTSGIESKPKGVIITHKNLIYQMEVINFNIMKSKSVLSYIPNYTMLNIVISIFYPIMLGITSYTFEYNHFLKNPDLWLKLLSKTKATTTITTDNDLHKFKKNNMNLIDLSNIKNMFTYNRVSKYTINYFSTLFYAHGFNRNSFLLSYNLTEHTLFVFLSGHIVDNQICYDITTRNDIEVVNNNIMIHSKSKLITRGYLNDEEKNINNYGIFHRGEMYLKTGDYGYVKNGYLYILGNKSNTIKINDKLVYTENISHDIENIYNDFFPDSIIIFQFGAINVLMGEIYRSNYILNNGIRRHLLRKYKICIHSILLFKYGVLPRTYTNKLSKRKCIKLYNSKNKENIIHQWYLKNNISYTNLEVSKKIQCILENNLLGFNIRLNENIIDLGIPKDCYCQMVNIFEKEFICKLKLDNLYNCKNIIDIEKYILQSVKSFTPLKL